MARIASQRLADFSAELDRLLIHGSLPSAQFEASDLHCSTLMVAMRDGVKLATDLYLPPILPAPVIAIRTPYNKSSDENVGVLFSFARRGYAVVSQDCRGTGGSEPDSWDYYVYESDDGYDLVEWITHQDWYGGFVGSFGGSYVGQNQWCMAMHPAMSTIVPMVSGLGFASNSAHLYMFLNAYARSVGKGQDKTPIPSFEMERLMIDETNAGGYFNEPLYVPFSPALLKLYPQLRELAPAKAQRWLWAHYCALSCAERAQFIKDARRVNQITSVDVEAMVAVFGHRISHDALTIPHVNAGELCRMVRAPPLLLTGWYDWCLNDAFATWETLRKEGHKDVAARARLIVGPHSHAVPGYHEGVERHTELMRFPRAPNFAALLLRWHEAMREGATDAWPTVIYYLMGANEWRVASDWPVPEARPVAFYFGDAGVLTREPPLQDSQPDTYTYEPRDPTPTVGGSILSWVYPPGSVDVSEAQNRSDVLVFTTPPLAKDLNVVGPLRVILYASSTAVDTDFVARLSDVFPDGRAIQIQSGILRARFHKSKDEPELLEPGHVYRFVIDLWATANQFKAGHRLRVDISSADFPKFDRNTNRGGEPGEPIPAHQTIYHDLDHPSQIVLSLLEG